MSQIEYSQTLGQQEEMERLLTQESFFEWLGKMPRDDFDNLLKVKDRDIFIAEYLKEHGLPLDSEIKGL